MVTRLHLEDLRVICHFMGILVLILGGAMVVPFVLAVLLGEYDSAVIFIKCIGITLLAGAILNMAKIERVQMMRHQALVVTGLSWVVLAFFGSLPLWMSGHFSSFQDAFFEGTSALTATGLSVALDIDHMALSMNTWRFVLHLAGGIGVLVIALALGVFGSGASAASVYSAEGREGRVMPEVKQMARFIFKVSAVIIPLGALACFVPLLLGGQGVVRAAFTSVWLSISAFATGGMTGQSMGIMAYHSWPLEVVTMLIMFFGVINFILYGDIWKGHVKNFIKDMETRTMAVWIAAIMLLVLAAVFISSSYYHHVGALVRRVLYLVVSASTNVGFSTMYSGQVLYMLGTGVFFVVGIAMIIGGSSSSTTGGIKAFRIGIIVRSLVQTIREALSADHVEARTFYYHRGRKLLTGKQASEALTVFLLYILTFAAGSVVGILCGYDALSAIFESISAASNGGLSSGIVGSGMPSVLETTYIVEMFLGRLEFVAIFAMLMQIALSLAPGHGLVKRGDGR